MRILGGVLLVATIAGSGGPAWAQESPVRYHVRIPEPEHHWLEVEVTFPDLGPAPLTARMSRSSPGRYAVHEFAKNVFQVSAFDAVGRPIATSRPDVDAWRVAGHGGAVRIVYRVFGDYADGTYLAVDTTHAHMNMPATFLWAEGLENRPIEIRFSPPAGSSWTAATQLFPTADPFAFTAPNLQYFMDSPTELGRLLESRFSVRDGPREARFRLAAHTDANQADLDALATLVARMAAEARAVFGTFPEFESGVYTFLLDYVPWVEDDAMEHRNSTYISDPGASIRTAAGRMAVLGTIAHEFFHVWNVERIRPAGLEPFDFTRQNITCCLWLAEGFTEYYGPLILHRAGLRNTLPLDDVATVMQSTARTVRSAVEMSEHGPFADAGVANDVDDRSRTFISYYTDGAALALALDLSIRERTGGRLSLDAFMRRLWERYGTSAAERSGYVLRPYTLADLRRELADLVGDAGFANSFFDRYVEGRERPEYPRLLALAGYQVQFPGALRGSMGLFGVEETSAGLAVGGRFGGALVPFDSPAYRAGLDRGDLIVAIDGQPATASAMAGIGNRRPGERVRLDVVRRDGRRVAIDVTLAPDPRVRIVEAGTPGAAGAATQAFRDAWLRSQAN